MAQQMFYNKLQYNAQFSRVMNSKYKLKCKKLKRKIKELVIENAALCDEAAEIQESIGNAKAERRFLLKKLMIHEANLETQMMINENVQASVNLNSSSTTSKRGPKKRTNGDKSIAKPKLSPKLVPSSKPKESKGGVMMQLNRDPDGKLVLPINLGSVLLVSLGEIIPDNPNFHSEHWIYPVGYVAQRTFSHPTEPQRKCVFTCKILNNSGVPQFQIIPDNEFDHVYFGESANICHLGLLEEIVRTVDIANFPLRAQGERFFGLGNANIMSFLQSNPNFQKCSNFKGFLVDGGYAAEDKDPTLNFNALQKLISISVFHTVPEIKDEPPEVLLE